MPGNAFVYGTLMADEVLRLLIKRVPPSRAATLSGYSRHKIRGQVFPAIVPATRESRVEGKVRLQYCKAQASPDACKTPPPLPSLLLITCQWSTTGPDGPLGQGATRARRYGNGLGGGAHPTRQHVPVGSASLSPVHEPRRKPLQPLHPCIDHLGKTQNTSSDTWQGCGANLDVAAVLLFGRAATCHLYGRMCRGSCFALCIAVYESDEYYRATVSPELQVGTQMYRAWSMPTLQEAEPLPTAHTTIASCCGVLGATLTTMLSCTHSPIPRTEAR